MLDGEGDRPDAMDQEPAVTVAFVAVREVGLPLLESGVAAADALHGSTSFATASVRSGAAPSTQ